ncbi:hypothetical protein RYX36_023957 [Vicia faba]
MEVQGGRIDPRSGFRSSNSIFYSKRQPISLPPNHSLDTTTFISSHAHQGHTAFIDASTGRHLTYTELWRSVEAVTSSLSSMGIKKGDIILLLSPNSIYFPVVCLAVMSLGAIITTTNPLNTTHEIAKQIADSKPVLAFTISSYPDEEVGQYPMAYVVRKDGSNISGCQIMEFVAAQVAPYKKIRKVAFISSIPKNPSGKILRKDLIKLATSKL